MNNVWYFDPIACAKAFNKKADLTSLDVIKDNYLAFIESISIVTSHEPIPHVTFYNKALNERNKIIDRKGYNFFIIDSEGNELVTNLDGNRTHWVKNGIKYLNIYPYTIEVTYQPQLIEASVRLNKLELNTSSLDTIKNGEDGIEYIA
jgi:hypothetical protein